MRSDGRKHRRRSEKERSRSRSRDREGKRKSSSRKSHNVDDGDERAIPDMGSFQQFPGQYSHGVMGTGGQQEPLMSGALPTAFFRWLLPCPGSGPKGPRWTRVAAKTRTASRITEALSLSFRCWHRAGSQAIASAADLQAGDTAWPLCSLSVSAIRKPADHVAEAKAEERFMRELG